jgi:hypothetical protein
MSSRAIGQLFRSLVRSKDCEPEQLIYIRIIDGAVRDAIHLRPRVRNRVFQPGVLTQPKVLERERKRLLAWVDSDDYWVTARVAGLSQDDAEYRREEIYWLVKCGHVCRCNHEDVPHEPHAEEYCPTVDDYYLIDNPPRKPKLSARRRK